MYYFSVVAPSGCAWTASSNQPWAVIVSGSSGTGSGSIGLQAPPPNTRGGPRTATLTVGNQGIVITQNQVSCAYSAFPSSYPLAAIGGPVSVAINAAPGCPWAITNNSFPAITVTSGLGNGNGILALTVSPNPSNSPRTFVLTFMADFGSFNYSIVQAGATQAILQATVGNKGTFTQSENAAVYTVTVSNSASLAASSGTVTVTEMWATDVTLVSMAGSGWTCPFASYTCSRSDALAAGMSYPPITVTVNVASTAAAQVTHEVLVSGGGSPNSFTIDPTNITPTALRFVPVTPCRVADTRNSAGPFGGPSIGGGTFRSFIVPNSSCGIPSTALAYSMNLTAVPAGPLGYITVWPSGQTQPVVSTLNSLDGRIKANAAFVPAGTGGGISVFATNNTHVVLDINGYFVPATDPTALAFFPVTPCRVADTRGASAPLGGPSIGGGQRRTFPILASTCSISSTAQAYSLNLTAVPPGPLGFITAWPTGQSQPGASSLNALTGTVTANAAIVPAGAGGAIDIFASNPTDMVIDINGYFAPMATGGLSLYNVTPCRVLDTRNPSGSPPFSGQLDTTIGGNCGVPSTAHAYVLNATVVPAEALGFLTLWPQSQSQPTVSTLNALDAEISSNMAIVPTVNGSISSFATNLTHRLLDIFGYFAP